MQDIIRKQGKIPFFAFAQKSVLWSLLVLALALRLPLLNGSFWMDEAAQALESTRPLSKQLEITADFQPPLLHLIVHFASYFSHSEWWLRTWGALLPGLITVWATYALGKKLFSTKVALWATLLLATSSLHIFFSQELRPYSLSAMWGMLATLTLVTQPFSFVKFTLFSLLGLYSSYLYPFLLLTHLFILWFQKNSAKMSLLSSIALAILYAPWLPRFFQQLQAGQSLRLEIPGWETVVSTPQLKALLLVPSKFIFGVLDLEVSGVFLVAGLAVAVGFVFLIFSCVQLASLLQISLWKNLLKNGFYLPQKIRNRESLITLTFLLVAPLLLAWVISFAVPVIQPKRVIFLLPFFFLWVSSVLDWVPPSAKKGGILWISLLFFINLWSTLSYWNNPLLQRENWKTLKQEIITTFPASSTIVVMSFDEAFAPWRWYEPTYPTLVTGKRFVEQLSEGELKEVLKPTFDKQYVLVFDYLRTLTDPHDRILQTLTEFGFVGRGVIDYPGIGFVRIYTRPDSALSFLPLF